MNLNEFYNYFSNVNLCFIEVLVNNEWLDLEWDPEEQFFKTTTGLKFAPISFVRKDEFKRGHVPSLDGTEYELRIVKGATILKH